MKQVTFQGEWSSLPRILSIMVEIKNPVWPHSEPRPAFVKNHAAEHLAGQENSTQHPGAPMHPCFKWESDFEK